MLRQSDFSAFKQEAKQRGIEFAPTVSKLLIAMDAAPALPNNAGIPQILSTIIDPEVVRILFAPTVSNEIMREQQKGNFAQDTIAVQGVEASGDVTAYGDYDENGGIQVNTMWATREQFRYQTMVIYGELEAQRAGLTLLNYVSEKQQAKALVLNTAANKFYFYGVNGLKNYGILNDPKLPTPIAAPAGSGGSPLWKDKEVVEIYNDILAMYEDLITRTNGIIGDGINMASPLTLCMSPQISVYFKRANEIMGNTVEKMVKDTFPNIKFVFAPQYSTDTGELVQMICDSAQGQNVGYLGYSIKLQDHAAIQMTSSWKQKTSAGTYGAVIKQPMLFAQMIGV